MKTTSELIVDIHRDSIYFCLVSPHLSLHVIIIKCMIFLILLTLNYRNYGGEHTFLIVIHLFVIL